MSMIIKDLRCNNMVCPLGVDDLPYFSFKIESDDKNFAIAKYMIELSNEKGIVWKSKWIKSDDQLYIPYSGPELLPETKYLWKVSVADAKNKKYVSDVTFFETGRKKEFNWEAKWITSDPRAIFIGNHWCKNTTAPFIRKTFEISKEVADATLYISGLGYYEAYVNGISVKDSVLDPGFTEYDKTVYYLTHKIKSLKIGKNALAILLGDGFYNADTEESWNFVNAAWRDHPKCICVLKIKYTDGSEEKIVSDDTFVGTVGPYIKNDVRSAEIYDARKELGDWTSEDYDDSSWNKVCITKAPGGALEGSYTTPIKVVDEYKPAKIIKVNSRYWIADAGFNTVGWALISFTAPRGTQIDLKFVENINDDLTLNTYVSQHVKPSDKELFQKETYIAKGEEKETWHAKFQYEGFRYIGIKCETGIPEDFEITIQEVRTALEKIGEFDCSDPIINKIQEVTCRSTTCNFHSIPTDCPHREKNGWTGDAQLSAEQLLLNFNGQSAYTKYMADVMRAQRKTGQLPGIVPSTGWGFNWGSGPAWDSVCAVIPYNMYLYCGDTRIVKMMYPVIKKYIDFCDTMAIGNLVCFGLGDWCPPDAKFHKQCHTKMTDTGYYYYDILVAAKFAKILGFEEDVKYFEDKAAAVKKSYRDYYIDNSNGEPSLKNCEVCQTAYAATVYFGFCEGDEDKYFVKKIADEIISIGYHYDAGILGNKYINQLLIDYGYLDLLVKVADNPEYPGIGNMIAMGATTLWEDFHGGASQNHHMYGDISSCFYKGIAGIRPCEDAPGFKKIHFTPGFPENMTYATGSHESPYGKISSSWVRSGKEINLSISVPSGCYGDIVLPEGFKFEDGTSSVKVGSGKYAFVIK